jgi:hypothetical protein
MLCSMEASWASVMSKGSDEGRVEQPEGERGRVMTLAQRV